MSSRLHSEDGSPNKPVDLRILRPALMRAIGGLGVSTPYALLDYPDEPSAGEGAAWLGALASLKAATGVWPAYVAKRANVDWDRLAEISGDILVFGRSTQTAFEPSVQEFRGELLRRAGDSRRILQLPALSPPEDDAEGWDGAFAGAGNRPAVVVSDRLSFEALSRAGRVVSLAPPMIVGLRPPRRPPLGSGTITLSGVQPPQPPPSGGHPPRTWLDEPPGLHRRLALRALLQGGLSRDRQRFWLYFLMSQARLERGISLLCSAREVMTDRLDAYLLGLVVHAGVQALAPAPSIANFMASWAHPSSRDPR